MKIDYYFSVMSPFTYLGSERFLAIVEKYNIEVEEKPFDIIGKIFANTGGIPVPKRHQSRQKYRLVEIERIGKKLDIPINPKPQFFPLSDPHLPAKFILASNKLGNKLNFSNICLKYLWSQEKDISDMNILQEICNGLSLNFEEMKKIASSPEIQIQYEKNSQQAIDSDVFGAPSYVFNGEVFWGQDRLDYLEDSLKI
tara:strand:- start:4938 stop:5531 length:594 start_codon:yes stop_codon:yes gene_type:complete